MLPAIKEFKTYEEQLSILEGRGLIVGDREKALQHLKEKNYYRLSAYSLTMRTKNAQTNEEHFYPDSTFEQIVQLYDFDAALRNVIIAASSVVETSLKSYLAYYHAQKYGPLGYLNNACFDDPWRHAKFLNALSRDIFQRRDEQFVQHHTDDLNGVFPIWAIVEICSFDQVSLMYKNLLPKDRSAIAKCFYRIPSREYIENWMQCAVVARNIAAHGGRFYNRPRMNPPAKLPKSLSSYSGKPFGYFYAIYHLLPRENRAQFLDGIQTDFADHPFALQKHLGMPPNWRLQIEHDGLISATPS